MKLAIISDIHGNLYALRKVIEDARVNKVDKYVFAGDYIFDLPFSNEVVHEIIQLKDAYFVAGNKERYLERLSAQDKKDWANIQMGAAYQTYRELQADVYEFLLAMKEECLITLDSGRKVYVTHYLSGLTQQSKEKCSSSVFRKKMLQSPFTHEEFLADFNALINQDIYREVIDDISASVIIFGHNHLQAYGYCDKRLVINPGSCGQPLDFNTGSPYTILEETASGFNVIEKRVEYDIEFVIGSAKRSSMYGDGKIWCELVFMALRTGQDYFGVMFEIARRIAASKGENGDFFSNDTWTEAYTIFMSSL